MTHEDRLVRRIAGCVRHLQHRLAARVAQRVAARSSRTTYVITLDDEYSRWPSRCHQCVHLHINRRHCDAFPDQPIPLEIWMGEIDHEQPFPGDHGIQFRQITIAELDERAKRARAAELALYKKILAEGRPLPEPVLKMLRDAGEID